VRVLLANKFFYRKGGSEAVMFQERDFLRERGVHVVDFSMTDPRNDQSDYSPYFVENRTYKRSGKDILRVIADAARLIHSREAVAKFESLLDATRPDIVHCHNIYHQLTPSIIGAAKRRGIRVALTLHDYKPVCPVYTRIRDGRMCSDCLGGAFRNVLRHRCADGSISKSAILLAEAIVQRKLGNYESVDMVLAPSRFMADAVTVSRFAKDRVRVLYNGVDLAGILPSEQQGRYILYMGRISHEKGIRTLLEAHTQMADGVELLVVGDGPMAKELSEHYGRARFLGFLSGSALQKVLSEAGVVVVPSEWYENCPMSILEAMAYGKTVVASEIGGIPELVLNHETGLLFTPGDHVALGECLQKVLKDDALRVKFGAAGRRRVEKYFSAERHGEELMQAYSSLL